MTQKEPSCDCHGEAMYWKPDPKMTAGGHWCCRVRRRELHRAWVERNRERRREQQRERYRRNPEPRKQRSRLWAKENPERHRKNGREWRKKNREKARSWSRDWSQANPEKHAEKERRRRARKADNLILLFTPEQLEQRLSMFGHRCWMCGDQADAVDHVKPIARGGAHTLANLRPVCTPCNSTKGATWPIEEVPL